ncbi:MAG TPA: bifunctional YncE family protein/alkaline phosphatase family protein [Balneolales bacterium]|nr:bifunctional YncE family protein/alkaline phosphatase family protein [Balneolales bacterium]
MKTFSLLTLVLFLAIGCSHEDQHWVISAPADTASTQIHQDAITVIPNGRLLTPLGHQITVAPHPYGLTLSPDGSVAVTANSGVRPFSISVIHNITGDDPQVMQIPPGARNDEGVLAAVFMGLTISPDNQTVYVAGGTENKIYIFNLNTGKRTGVIHCAMKEDGHDYTDGYIGDMVLSKDGSRLYAVDQIGFRMIIIDTYKRKVIANVPVGRYPFGITLSPDGSRAYVANAGMFQYHLVGGLTKDNLDSTGLHFPAFAYGSKEMKEGIHNDTLNIPGLGDPNVPQSFSVWTVDINNDASHVISKIKTGVLVGQKINGIPAVGGSSPNSVVATGDYVFVSNGNNDNISVISAKKDTVVHTVKLTLDPRIDRLRGIIPFGLAVSPDGKRLYVAESGINAVGVIDIPAMKLLGHIPVGWFPSKLRVSQDGKKLIVANAKGFGSGPNGGSDFHMGPEGSYIGNIMKGTVSVFDIPADSQLDKLTQDVISNNFRFRKADNPAFTARKNNPVPLYPGQKKSPIKYIVFVSKENRTYDEVFGQIKKGRGDAALARYGEHVTFSNEDGTKTVTDATVMPNHLALARMFAISDNFYTDSDVSADGHRWLVDNYPNEWMETGAAASYGGKRNLDLFSKAPGKFGFVGASASYYPEDYNEEGAMWDQFMRHGVGFFNFGFSLEMAPGYEKQAFKYAGIRYLVNYPVSPGVFNNSSHIYATFNTAVPDQFRFAMFKKEFNKRWAGPNDTLPQVMTVYLPNDHGSGERPKDGYPFVESYMADNDLALGRLVEFLSHTRYWKNMAIIVTEDDPQSGVDHVDAHRSILMVISPWAKRDYVGHVHYSFGSIHKTIWNVLGVPYLNQYDASATDLSDLFRDKPDFTPYNALPEDHRIFDPQKALTPLDAKFDWKAVKNAPPVDDPTDMEAEHRRQDKKTGKDRFD